MKLAPIALFTFKRLDTLKLTVEALQKNMLASESDLIIFSDAAKKDVDIAKVTEVRAYIKTITGFNTITVHESPQNKGLANSIIDGVSHILENHETLIVLEDDLLSSPNFLDFMNQALSFYKEDSKVISISGYTLALPSLKKYSKDYYYGCRASSWGWGIWANRWKNIDWNNEYYNNILTDKKIRQKLNRGGSDMSNMLKKQLNGKIDSWAIRFCYHQSVNDMITVFPTNSKIISIGFGESATHTTGTKRFITNLDTSLKRKFCFNSFKKMDDQLVKEFSQKFSIKTRLIDKIKQKLS